ncbi:MAG: hypothetical protein JNM51_08945 [Bacteroidia bacterium]|nr:hypothetical protein [Bacteroidia bacterium]
MKNNDYNLNDEPNLPLDNNGRNPFDLPDDYFLKFENNLKQKLELDIELQEFPLLSSIKKTKAFIVPHDYFISTENSLECKTELEFYNTLSAFKKPVFTDLNEDYKKQLQSSINHKIEIVEELKSYERLYTLDKVNSFSVSENYFDMVSERIKERIHKSNKAEASILDTLLTILFGKTVAFSFGVLLITGLSFYFYQTPQNVIQSSDCKTLACLERNEILNNSEVITNFDEEQLLDLVDVNSLNEQLNSKKENHKPDTKQNMDSMSEDDLLNEL